ncbi:unnamed protein product [Candidula unifasciata]|uniref:Uncharacterized protein n=1 Tax=Candidula unifasciata TaxID=100452 RepID=A0A8S4A079_9EUPU|nr:unnamed protein product [Candidula unifasciata]
MLAAVDVHGKLTIRLHKATSDNNTWIGVIDDGISASDDSLGALYYVVAVILIYGMSIVMMIASHIRKNKQDNQLRNYLKEMAKLRKDDRRDQVLSKMTDLAMRRQQEECKQKLQEKLKDTSMDSDADSETSQLVQKVPREDTADSSFLSPDYCNSPESTSPLSDSRYTFVPERTRTPSFHEYRKWKRKGNRSQSLQDYKQVRTQGRQSNSLYDHRAVFIYTDKRSTSQNELRLSPLCSRERSSAVHETHPFRWYNPKLSPAAGSAKFHKVSVNKQSKQTCEIRINLPANFHIVDEDGVL